MKRDLALVREILLQVEEENPKLHPVCVVESHVKVEGYDARTIESHINLLVEGGLLARTDDGDERRPTYILRLTWKGHNYLDSIR